MISKSETGPDVTDQELEAALEDAAKGKTAAEEIRNPGVGTVFSIHALLRSARQQLMSAEKRRHHG